MCSVPKPDNWEHLRADEKQDLIVQFLLKEIAILRSDANELRMEIERLKNMIANG